MAKHSVGCSQAGYLGGTVVRGLCVSQTVPLGLAGGRDVPHEVSGISIDFLFGRSFHLSFLCLI